MTRPQKNTPPFEDIFESLAEAVIAVDTDMNISVFNQSAEKMAEVSRSLVIGKPLEAYFSKKNPRLIGMLGKTLNEGRLFAEYEEKLFRRITGDTIPVGITTSQIIGPEGNLRGAVALIKDLSGIKSLEAGALRKERLAYIGTFAANVAHEIKNPLSGIRGAAQLLSRKVKEPDLSEYMEVIIKEADRLNGILNGMLDFSRPARLEKRPFNVHKMLDEVCLLQESEAAFIKSYDPSIPEISGDEGQLKQVFINLVKNAREAVGKGGGVIQIATRAITDFHLIGDGSAGRMISIRIKDNGCGIAQEELEQIFTPFFTTKLKGTGLGMPISLKIVKEHGGLIKIDSEPGKGTSVDVLLPIAEK